jgi:hypothetical protein
MKRPPTHAEIIEKQEKTDKITRKVVIVFVFAGVFYFFIKLLFL